MSQPQTPSHFVWQDCLTPDIDKALSYFEKLVSWKVLDQTWPNVGRYPIVKGEIGPIAGFLELPKFLQESGVPSYWTGYVETNINSAQALVPTLGGQMFTMPTQTAMGTSFVFTDPGGAVLAAYELSDSFKVPSSSGLSEFVWRRLYSADWYKSIQFYHALFGWKQSEHGTNTILDRSDTAIADMAGAPNWISVDTWVYFLGVENLASTVAAIEKFGGTILVETKVDDRCAVISNDSHGAVIGFVQWG